MCLCVCECVCGIVMEWVREGERERKREREKEEERKRERERGKVRESLQTEIMDHSFLLPDKQPAAQKLQKGSQHSSSNITNKIYIESISWVVGWKARA